MPRTLGRLDHDETSPAEQAPLRQSWTATVFYTRNIWVHPRMIISEVALGTTQSTMSSLYPRGYFADESSGGRTNSAVHPTSRGIFVAFESSQAPPAAFYSHVLFKLEGLREYTVLATSSVRKNEQAAVVTFEKTFVQSSIQHPPVKEKKGSVIDQDGSAQHSVAAPRQVVAIKCALGSVSVSLALAPGETDRHGRYSD
ncbi:hypothetical protein EI94DRAFT_1701372 [Lactarius quietus]|nr:hypothetical protein EI94DRAFT_1701372 [Lactarius quietus]